MQGADVEQLRVLAKRLLGGAETLERIVVETGSGLTYAQWQGPDSQQFRNRWDAELQRVIRQVAQGLTQASETVARNADEQEQASSINGSVSRNNQTPGTTTRQGGRSAGATHWATTWAEGESILDGLKGTITLGGVDGLRKREPIDPSIKVQLVGWKVGDGLAAENENGRVRAGVHSEGGIYVGTDGLDASGSFLAGIQGTMKANQSVGDHMEFRGEATGTLGVLADGKVKHSETGVTAEGKAFIGASIEGKAGAEVAGVYGGVTGEAWAGLGVEGKVDIGFNKGKLGVEVDVGAAFGVGGKVGIDFEVDPGKVSKAFNDAGQKIAEVWPW